MNESSSVSSEQLAVSSPVHRSGYVNIIGRPNVGKSTLMNALVGERMSIISAKPQTTRHRIIGLLSGDDFQIIFSDTPGVIREPSYKMQEVMNKSVKTAFEDADLLLFLTEPGEPFKDDDPLLLQIKKLKATKFLILNKLDKISPERAEELIAAWMERIPFDETLAISALKKINTDLLLEKIKSRLPESPEYYPKDQLTDRPERFFVSEIIREKILELYRQEIPYSTEVSIEEFKETETKDGLPLVRIAALIFVARESQKPIILGKNGAAVKRLGTEARKSLEIWLEKKVFLDLHIKVRDNWRDDENMLRKFGYE